MRRSSVVIAGLAAALVLTNAAWVYALLDSGVSYTYLDDSYRTARVTANQAMALLPMVARSDLTKEGIVAAAVRTSPSAQPFEKEGFVWVNNLGLRFDNTGALVEVRPNVDPF